MNWNLVGSIYGRSSIKIAHFVPIHKQTWSPQAILVSDWPILKILLFAAYQVSVHMAKQFQRRRFFRNRPIRNKNCMWWPCLLPYRDEMSNLHRGHSIDASYQACFFIIDNHLLCPDFVDLGSICKCFWTTSEIFSAVLSSVQ
jgi:hypothetical protein